MGEPFKFVKKFNDFFDWSTEVFTAAVAHVLKRPKRYVAIFVLMLVAVLGLFKIVPKALVPNEDQGVMIAITNLPPASALHRTVDYIDNLSKDFDANALIKNNMSMIGFDLFTSSLKENAGVSFVIMKDYSERNMTSQQMSGAYMAIYIGNPNAMTFFVNPPPIQGLSLTDGFEMYLQNRSGKTYNEIQQDVNKVLAAAAQRKDLVNVRTTLDTIYPQFELEIDRDKLKA